MKYLSMSGVLSMGMLPGFTGGSSSWNSQVSWTGRERIRCLGYRFRLAIEEVNYAARRMIEPQTRLP
jgi:hypothetical protein